MRKATILFLSANPTGTIQLKLDEEVREIEAKIRASEHRESLELITKWAVRPDDLLQSLNQHKPHIVHFSGHGSATEEIILLDKQDKPKPVSKEALVSLFRTLKGNIRVVLLNACFSRPQADAITKNIDIAIGMKREIGDEAAITFAASFYRAIGFGHSVKDAFDQGTTALLLQGIPEHRTPALLTRKTVQAESIVLVTPSDSPPRGGEPSPASLPPAKGTVPDFNAIFGASRKLPQKIVSPIDLPHVWSRYAAMRNDWESGPVEEGDGLLTRAKLQAYIAKLQRTRSEEYRRRASTEWTDKRLADARNMLHDMEAAGADGIDYLPKQLAGFPAHLKRRATELLMRDDRDTLGEICQVVIDNARSRYLGQPRRSTSERREIEEALKDVDELAKKLGLD